MKIVNRQSVRLLKKKTKTKYLFHLQFHHKLFGYRFEQKQHIRANQIGDIEPTYGKRKKILGKRLIGYILSKTTELCNMFLFLNSKNEFKQKISNTNVL